MVALGLLFGTARVFAADTPQVALEMSSLDAVAYRELDGLALEKGVVLRLVQEGFAVVAADRQPEVRVRFLPRDNELVILVLAGERSAQRSVVRGKESLVELHFEVAQKVVELVRGMRTAETPAASPPPPPPLVAAPVPSPVVAAKASRPITFELGVGLDALVRPGGTDPLVLLTGRLGIGAGIGVHLVTGVAPSVSPSITVVEWQLQAGAGYRFSLHKRVGIEASLLVGMLVHAFDISMPAAAASGTRVDFLGTAPLLLDVFLHRRVALSVRLAPGVSSESRTHTSGMQTLWNRGAGRLETGLGLHVSFP